ncbi:MAG: tyrosine--tRNA ligase [Pseudomonadales bacterium]|nr:tyrosine--tRNA ligase [Pseudomonadales bacterium]
MGSHVKIGIDATGRDLHIGHLVPFSAFRSLVRRGCKGTVVIGDITGQIGDPSGRDTSRPLLSFSETSRNAADIMAQICRFMGDGGEWGFVKNSAIRPPMDDLFELLGSVSIRSMLGRDHFSKRHASGGSISILEMVCPVLQAWDSISLGCDLEIGGNDQLANCTLARDLMGRLGMKKQAIMLFPILTGTDGSHKMSKSLGNHISMNSTPDDAFGKTMSIPDGLMDEWFSLLFQCSSPPGLEVVKKQALALAVVEMLHGRQAAKDSMKRFDLVCKQKVAIPHGKTDVPLGSTVVDALVLCGMAQSRSDARRLITGRGVKIDGNTVSSIHEIIMKNGVLQRGKRNCVSVVVGERVMVKDD